MSPLQTVDTTHILGAPKDWDAEAHGQCAGLPIVRVGPWMQSFWSPTWRDRIRILFGQPIRLVVATHTHPPVKIDTETVFA